MTNRQFTSSPDLTFQRDRLQRDVTLKQQVFTSLTQSYEEVRIREVRDTPVITVIETPSVPTLPEPRGRLVRVLFGLIFGALFGAFIAFVSGAIARRRQEGDSEADEFVNTLGEVKGKMLGRFRRMRRRTSEGSVTVEHGMAVTQILILTEAPFTRRDYDRFGVDLLRKNFHVSILDCTSWLKPEFWKKYSAIAMWPSVISIPSALSSIDTGNRSLSISSGVAPNAQGFGSRSRAGRSRESCFCMGFCRCQGRPGTTSSDALSRGILQGPFSGFSRTGAKEYCTPSPCRSLL